MQSRPPMPVTNQYEWCNKTRCQCIENQFEWQATWLHFLQGQVNSIDHKQVIRIHHDRAFVHVCAGLCFELFFLFKIALCRNLCLSYALTSLPSLVCAELCSALVGFIHSCWLCSFHLRKSFILCIIVTLFFPWCSCIWPRNSERNVSIALSAVWGIVIACSQICSDTSCMEALEKLLGFFCICLSSAKIVTTWLAHLQGNIFEFSFFLSKYSHQKKWRPAARLWFCMTHCKCHNYIVLFPFFRVFIFFIW